MCLWTHSNDDAWVGVFWTHTCHSMIVCPWGQVMGYLLRVFSTSLTLLFQRHHAVLLTLGCDRLLASQLFQHFGSSGQSVSRLAHTDVQAELQDAQLTHWVVLLIFLWFGGLKTKAKDASLTIYTQETIISRRPLVCANNRTRIAPILQTFQVTRYILHTEPAFTLARLWLYAFSHGSHTSGPTKNKDFSRTFPGPWSNL